MRRLLLPLLLMTSLERNVHLAPATPTIQELKVASYKSQVQNSQLSTSDFQLSSELPVPVYQTTEVSYFTDTHGAWGPLHPWQDDFVACWEFPRGSKLEVKHENKCCTVTVQDRGPAKHLVRRGRTKDLSAAAFKKLAPFGRGVIQVSWRVISEEVGEVGTVTIFPPSPISGINLPERHSRKIGTPPEAGSVPIFRRRKDEL